MKKILISIFLLVSVLAMAEWVSIYRVQTKAEPFYRTLASGTIIHEVDSAKFFMLTHTVTATQTMADVFTNGWFSQFTTPGEASLWTRGDHILQPTHSDDSVFITGMMKAIGWVRSVGVDQYSDYLASQWSYYYDDSMIGRIGFTNEYLLSFDIYSKSALYDGNATLDTFALYPNAIMDLGKVLYPWDSLHVRSIVTQDTAYGLILSSKDGTQWRFTVSDTGIPQITEIPSK